ncbi:MAG: nonstructural protein [Microvirus sp.]|nr:MAG: nonstructural protein [Microvirus sp.]
MNYGIFSLHDAKASSFAQPFYCPNRAVAQRHFMAALEDPNSICSKFPADFRLYELGTFDDSTGIISVHPLPVLTTPHQE